MVAIATEQHMVYNIAQNKKEKSPICPIHVCILNMIDWSKEGIF